MMKHVLLVVCLFLVSCSVSRRSIQTFNADIKNNRCEEAAKNIPGFKMKKVSAQLTRTPLRTSSYLLTGVAYAGDTVLYVAGGIVAPVVVCMVPLYLEGKAHGNGRLTAWCYDKVHNGLVPYDKDQNLISVGEKVYQLTEQWRCPDYSGLVDDLLKVSKCHYENKNYAKSKAQLEILMDHKQFGGCISSEKVELVKKTQKKLFPDQLSYRAHN